MFYKVLIFFLIYNNVQYVTGQLNKPEGSKCMTQSGNGTCVTWYKCLTTVYDSQHRNYPPICSYNGAVPVICCDSCKFDDDIRMLVVSPLGGLLRKTGQKAWDKCIDYFVDLDYPCKNHFRGGITKVYNKEKMCSTIEPFYVGAAGGRDSNRGEFPHMALLGYGRNILKADWVCGGSVISEKFILTAGHCISSATLGPVKYAALGILKRSDPPELWQRYLIQRIIPHPEYQSPLKYHDIALLKTRKRISFNQNVVPACLAVEEKRNLEDEETHATGWGALGRDQELADTLQAVYLQEFNNEKCSSLYSPNRLLRNGYNHTTQMCYGDNKEERDTCGGDSGGPLQVKGQIISICQYAIIGVTSYGRNCPSEAGIYTRVKHYLPWIESIVWP